MRRGKWSVCVSVIVVVVGGGMKLASLADQGTWSTISELIHWNQQKVASVCFVWAKSITILPTCMPVDLLAMCSLLMCHDSWPSMIGNGCMHTLCLYCHSILCCCSLSVQMLWAWYVLYRPLVPLILCIYLPFLWCIAGLISGTYSETSLDVIILIIICLILTIVCFFYPGTIYLWSEYLLWSWLVLALECPTSCISRSNQIHRIVLPRLIHKQRCSYSPVTAGAALKHGWEDGHIWR